MGISVCTENGGAAKTNSGVPVQGRQLKIVSAQEVVEAIVLVLDS